MMMDYHCTMFCSLNKDVPIHPPFMSVHVTIILFLISEYNMFVVLIIGVPCISIATAIYGALK